MTEVVQMWSAITFISMHNPAFEQDIPEVMVHSCFFIVAGTASTLKKVIIWYISGMGFPTIPFDILHHGIAYWNISIFIVLRIYDMQDIFIHVNILHS